MYNILLPNSHAPAGCYSLLAISGLRVITRQADIDVILSLVWNGAWSLISEAKQHYLRYSGFRAPLWFLGATLM